MNNSDIKYERMLITPEKALEFLNYNTNNRKISRRQVAKWKYALENGKWKENGDSIRFNKSGIMIDGQHRCHAIVETGISVWCLVVTGIADDAFWTIDKGAPKTTVTSLNQFGEKCATRLAGALGLVLRYESGRMNVRTELSTEQILSTLEKHPNIRESVSKFSDSKRIIPPSVAIACHYLFAKRDAELADMFMRAIIENDGMIKGDPMWRLRQRLEYNLASKSKLSNEYIMALTIKTWNAERKCTGVKSLRFTESGDRLESFPSIV